MQHASCYSSLLAIITAVPVAVPLMFATSVCRLPRVSVQTQQMSEHGFSVTTLPLVIDSTKPHIMYWFFIMLLKNLWSVV